MGGGGAPQPQPPGEMDPMLGLAALPLPLMEGGGHGLHGLHGAHHHHPAHASVFGQAREWAGPELAGGPHVFQDQGDWSMSLDFLNEALEAEEVSLMRSLNEPAGGAEPGAKQPGESSGSESSFDKMLNDREVVLAAASAAGLQKTGGLKRVAFSMNDLTALNPRGPAAAAAGVGKPAKPSKKKPPNMPSVPEGRQPPAPAEIKLEHPFANVNVGGPQPMQLAPGGYPGYADGPQLLHTAGGHGLPTYGHLGVAPAAKVRRRRTTGGGRVTDAGAPPSPPHAPPQPEYANAYAYANISFEADLMTNQPVGPLGLRRVQSAGDLSSTTRVSQLSQPGGGAFPAPPAALAPGAGGPVLGDPAAGPAPAAAVGYPMVGKLTPQERRQRILRYRQKRHERNFKKRIKYVCRKTLADSRPRIRGRFATNEEWEELKRQQAEKEKLGKKDTGPKVTAPKTLPVSKGKAKK